MKRGIILTIYTFENKKPTVLPQVFYCCEMCTPILSPFLDALASLETTQVSDWVSRNFAKVTWAAKVTILAHPRGFELVYYFILKIDWWSPLGSSVLITTNKTITSIIIMVAIPFGSWW